MKTNREIDQETKEIIARNPELAQAWAEYKDFMSRPIARTALKSMGLYEGFTTYMEVKLKGVDNVQ